MSTMPAVQSMMNTASNKILKLEQRWNARRDSPKFPHMSLCYRIRHRQMSQSPPFTRITVLTFSVVGLSSSNDFRCYNSWQIRAVVYVWNHSMAYDPAITYDSAFTGRADASELAVTDWGLANFSRFGRLLSSIVACV